VRATAAEQLLLDMTSIKTILADLPTLSQSGGDPPRRYVATDFLHHHPPQASALFLL
jgi:hypothetical protein